LHLSPGPRESEKVRRKLRASLRKSEKVVDFLGIQVGISS
jgi:hypothetical protein